MANQVPQTLQEDDDVIREKRKVERAFDQFPNHQDNELESDSSAYLIKAKDLRKVYPNGYLAVQDNTFGVKEHQVLGLLGPNGAGKSTTFSMLTME